MAGEVLHAHVGDIVRIKGHLTIEDIAKHQCYDWRNRETLDKDINSPKSVRIHPNGKKYYVNSLEGDRTVVYDMATNRKLQVIHHSFTDGNKQLWNKPSGLYPFSGYSGDPLVFNGKPVESVFVKGGQYLLVTYYRRSFDLNAQDPSALAVIDTRRDAIVRMIETGPLPKMIAVSPDDKTVAVTHWGNNTVGLLDISSSDPRQWHYVACVAVGKKLDLHFSRTEKVNRDAVSGLKLRGTVFLPGNRYLLVSCMSGAGGIAVIDIQKRAFLGMLHGMMPNVRHMIIKNSCLYLSVNLAGYVQRIPLDSVMHGISRLHNGSVSLHGWTTCKVFPGTRTICASPSGRYIFAACSYGNHLAVIDTKTMKMIGSMVVDSYPVGLDVSPDGRYVIVTSQGQKHHGGNAVNVLRIDYVHPEVAAPSAVSKQKNVDLHRPVSTEPSVAFLPKRCIAAGALALLALLAVIWIYKRFF